MSTKDELPKGWVKSTPRPQEPNIDWVSVERLLDNYTIPVLAEAIETLNVQTYDAIGRRTLATDGDKKDIRSKAFAIACLEHRYSMLVDPGPDDYLFDERVELEGSPLDLFGWPKAELPDLNPVNPHHLSKVFKISVSLEGWITQAQAIAKEYLSRHNANDLHPSLEETSEYVAVRMRKLKVYGPHKKPLEPAYIKRHALQSEFWKSRNTY